MSNRWYNFHHILHDFRIFTWLLIYCRCVAGFVLISLQITRISNETQTRAWTRTCRHSHSHFVVDVIVGACVLLHLFMTQIIIIFFISVETATATAAPAASEVKRKSIALCWLCVCVCYNTKKHGCVQTCAIKWTKQTSRCVKRQTEREREKCIRVCTKELRIHLIKHTSVMEKCASAAAAAAAAIIDALIKFTRINQFVPTHNLYYLDMGR